MQVRQIPLFHLLVVMCILIFGCQARQSSNQSTPIAKEVATSTPSPVPTRPMVSPRTDEGPILGLRVVRPEPLKLFKPGTHSLVAGTQLQLQLEQPESSLEIVGFDEKKPQLHLIAATKQLSPPTLYFNAENLRLTLAVNNEVPPLHSKTLTVRGDMVCRAIDPTEEGVWVDVKLSDGKGEAQVEGEAVTVSRGISGTSTVQGKAPEPYTRFYVYSSWSPVEAEFTLAGEKHPGQMVSAGGSFNVALPVEESPDKIRLLMKQTQAITIPVAESTSIGLSTVVPAAAPSDNVEGNAETVGIDIKRAPAETTVLFLVRAPQGLTFATSNRLTSKLTIEDNQGNALTADEPAARLVSWTPEVAMVAVKTNSLPGADATSITVSGSVTLLDDKEQELEVPVRLEAGTGL
jgi:hypothetical protein